MNTRIQKTLISLGVLLVVAFFVVGGIAAGGTDKPMPGWVFVFLGVALPCFLIPAIPVIASQMKQRSRMTPAAPTDQKASTSQQQFQVANAQGIIWFLGVGAIVGGVLGLMGLLPFSPWPTLVGGVVFCALAYRVRKQSRGALLAALALLGCTVLWNIVVVVRTFAAGGVPLNIGAVAIGLGLFFALLRVYRRTSSQTTKD